MRIVATLAAMMLCAPASAQPTDTAVEAAFIPRFARYVTWPPAATPKGADPFVLCVIGADPFGAALDDSARSQLIDGRRITVRRMDFPAGTDNCQIAFVSGGRSSAALAALAGKPVLTVTNTGSARGIIHFIIADGRVRFFIDQSAATQRGLVISSRLLALAIGVKQ